MTVPINSRAELIDALRSAAELEHQLMCQYLFAVYSFKRYPYEDLEPWELERVRRWSSKVTLVARQEMEHLGLALNLLASIGGTPSFTRPNMPQRLKYYGHADIKLTLTPGNLKTIERFQRFEAPEELLGAPMPSDDASEQPPPIDQEKAKEWCRLMEEEGFTREQVMQVMMSGPQFLVTDGRLLQARHSDLVRAFPFSSVQDLYQSIAEGFQNLSGSLGEGNLFIGRKDLQIFGGPTSPQHGSMNDLNQYGLDLIPIVDLKSALNAIRMILEQGEGVRVPPKYLPHTHFCIFTGIREEMEKYKLTERACRNVVRNPMTAIESDVCPVGEVNLITNGDTLRVSALFNDCYEVMLLLLLYLYSDQVKTTAQVNALMDAAFFPFMTMFIRPLAEMLTEMPAFDDGRPGNAGPGFELPSEILLFPNLGPKTWTLFQERLDAIVAKFPPILQDDPWIDLPGQKEPGHVRSQLWRRLDYLRDNMTRLASDWRNDWLNIGRTE